ncbi:hypothetical protein [Candidatus Skiveiella danica]|uniref:hypothetical protein n=1 Tax=Candidatus Skiveiella danica TaxID=3386177 RepID=UPI0039B872AD
MLIGLVSNNGQTGGLGGLAEKFNAVASRRPNARSPEISGCWGDLMNPATLGERADAAGQLAQGLPDLIDRLTPQGEAPEGGFGNAGDLFGMLGGMLQK